MKFYFDHFCCRKFKARFLKTKDFCLWEKIFWERNWPIEQKFSGLVVLSKFCRMIMKLFHPLHFVEVMHCQNICWIFCIRLNSSSFHSQISILITVRYLSSFENCKNDSFWSTTLLTIISWDNKHIADIAT